MNRADEAARAAVEAAVRAAYGRLLAILARQWRDIAAAEDALGQALATALDHWPRHGVPRSPEGWLLTAARRNMLKGARRRRLEENPAVTILLPHEGDFQADPPAFADDRLRLMFACAHPAIDPPIRTALILQTVLGIEAARIATAYLVSAEAMTKRLVRAKAKIKEAGVRFEEPDPQDLRSRVDAVLEAIYAACTLGCGAGQGGAPHDLSEEALYLAGLAAAHLPADPEAQGLHSLLLFIEARKPASFGSEGDFVPLDQHDTSRWNRTQIHLGNALLMKASALQDLGPFQLEAAIQAAHCNRMATGVTPWADILKLYERLLALSPTIGGRIGHAIALASITGKAHRSLEMLDSLDFGQVKFHQPWWASRAHLLVIAGDLESACYAFTKAISLTADPRIRRYLTSRLSQARGPLH